MAAGDLLTTVPWSHELNGYVVGDGDPWAVVDVIGWVGEDVQSQDQPFDLVAGAAAGVDTVGSRVITLNLDFVLPPEIVTAEEAEAAAMVAGAELVAAFTAGEDVELHAILPGLGHVYLTGRARGAKETTVTEAAWGELVMQATFVATDPTIVSVP